MSDEALVLSTAPPALAAEQEFDAICSTLMATARGRWFLREYARRNRNSDTAEVLAALERMASAIAGNQAHQASREMRLELLEMARAISQARAVGGNPPAQSDITAAAERLRDLASTMRACGIELTTFDQIQQLADTILSTTSLRDLGDRQTRELGDVLHYLEHRIDLLLDKQMEEEPAPADAAPTLESEVVRPADHDRDGAWTPAASGTHTEAAATAVAEPATEEVQLEVAQHTETAAAVAGEFVPAIEDVRVSPMEIEVAPFVVIPPAPEGQIAPDVERPEAESTGARNHSAEEVPVEETAPATLPGAESNHPSPGAAVSGSATVAMQVEQDLEELVGAQQPVVPADKAPGADARPALTNEASATIPAIASSVIAAQIIATATPEQPVAATPVATPMPRQVADDPLAALNAASDEERIALFS
jgi:hypothetical protein